MSQQFKSKYEQMRENSQSVDPESQTPDLTDNGPIRNICFVLEDGSMTFLNYGYLISGSLNESKIKLDISYTTHEVEIYGSNLEKLFNKLVFHRVSMVKISNIRYWAIENLQEEIISKIVINRTTNSL